LFLLLLLKNHFPTAARILKRSRCYRRKTCNVKSLWDRLTDPQSLPFLVWCSKMVDSYLFIYFSTEFTDSSSCFLFFCWILINWWNNTNLYWSFFLIWFCVN
jgi:hypothetical protein